MSGLIAAAIAAHVPTLGLASNTPDYQRNLVDAEILEVGDDGRLRFDERITLAAAQTELLLAADVRSSIQLIAGATPPPAP